MLSLTNPVRRYHKWRLRTITCPKFAAANENAGLGAATQEIHDALDELNEARRQQDRYDDEVAPLIVATRQALSTLQHTANVMPDQMASAELQLVESLRLDFGSRCRYALAVLNLERVLGTPVDSPFRGARPY